MILAQLTDLHVCKPGTLFAGSIDTLAQVEHAVARLNALRPRMDGVVISGDLVDRGDAVEYAALRPMLDRLEMPWWPVPGNHDGDVFWDVFADRLPGAVRDVGCAIEHAGARIVLLDTRVPGADHGLLDAARLDWLGARFAAGTSGPCVLVMHHPPFDTGIEFMDGIGLHGRERLPGVLAPSPPLAILCGHVHRTIRSDVGGVPATIAPSTAFAIDFDPTPGAVPRYRREPPTFLVHLVASQGLVSHTLCVDEHGGAQPFPS